MPGAQQGIASPQRIRQHLGGNGMRTDLQRERHVALYMLVEAEKAADEREGHAGLQHAQRAPLRTYEIRRSPRRGPTRKERWESMG